MLRLDALVVKPAACVSLTGLTPGEFQALYESFAPAYQRHRDAATTTRRDRRPRRRAPGGGSRYACDLEHRLLMALVWLKVYPTYEVLGFLFDLHKRNTQLNVRAVLEVLELLDDFPFDRPSDDRRRLRSVQEVMEAFPEVRLVIDSKEQRVYRPAGPYERQKPFYSGKKKTHTHKVQLGVLPSGMIASISPPVPGAVNDVRLLRETGLLNQLLEGEAALADKGYEGADQGYRHGILILPRKNRKRRPLTEADLERNRKISRHRVVAEHANAQLNRFTVLRQVYRGSKLRHGQVIRSVAVLVNRRTRIKPLNPYLLAA
jgi:DDE superfamily endonuclease